MSISSAIDIVLRSFSDEELALIESGLMQYARSRLPNRQPPAGAEAQVRYLIDECGMSREAVATEMRRLLHEARQLADLVLAVCASAPTLHRAGTLQHESLEALYRHATQRRVAHSAETGSGASTLLLSHLSANHTAFTVDAGASVTNVKRSPLLRPGIVHWVEGPTQLTLPAHQFTAPLQLVLIDGPHAWPFPDLEYYYFYPHIEAGGLLIIDDLQIRSIGRMFEILKVDAMWRVEEVTGNTAFLVRTDAPTFCPTGDSWDEQRYNTI